MLDEGTADEHLMLARRHRVESKFELPDGTVLISAFMLAAAGLVHLAVAPAHYDHWWLFGVLFGAAAGVQFAQAVALARRPSPAVVQWIGIVNLVVVVTWLWSRMIGLPVGPGAGTPEPVGWLDLLTTYDEAILLVLLFAGCGWIGSMRSGALRTSCHASGLALAIVLTVAFAGGMGHGHV